MATVLVAGLGDLGSRAVSALCGSPAVDRVVAVGRNAEHGVALVSQAALVAELLGGPSSVAFRQADLRDTEGLSRTLIEERPDVVVAAASLHTWWRQPAEDFARARLARVPYGTWLPLHVVPVRWVMEAIRAAGSETQSVCLPFPDAVGPVLAGMGLAPTVGAGNIQEVAAKVRHLLRTTNGDDYSVRLVMHHAVERYAFGAFSSLAGDEENGEPPWHGEIRVAGTSLPLEEVRTMVRTPYPLLPGRDVQELTAAAALEVIHALLADVPRHLHAPAPSGLPGGYPVRVSRRGATIDLSGMMSLEDAVALNREAAAWDGIETIEPDGTIVYTDRAARLMRDMLGLRYERVSPGDLDAAVVDLSRHVPA